MVAQGAATRDFAALACRRLVVGLWFYIFTQALGVAYSATQVLTPYAIPFVSVDEVSTNATQAVVVLLQAPTGSAILSAWFSALFCLHALLIEQRTICGFAEREA